MMGRYYRVIKDHPMWEVGTILKKEDNQYFPIDAFWVKDIEGVNERWCEGDKLIENQPEWFKRVYEINVLGRLNFATKEVAKATMAKLFKEK